MIPVTAEDVSVAASRITEDMVKDDGRSRDASTYFMLELICILFDLLFQAIICTSLQYHYTVEPRYLELGYLEQLAISNRFPFPLVFL